MGVVTIRNALIPDDLVSDANTFVLLVVSVGVSGTSSSEP